MRLRPAVALVAAVALLSACGFKPAGSRPLPEPLKKVHVDVVTRYRVSESPLEASLRARLLRQGAQVTKESEEATAAIKLTSLRETRQVLSVGPDGKAQEFLLIASVDYEVTAGTQVLVPPGSLRVSRAYSFNEDQILAKEAEENRLREYIQDQLAELVLLRIETQLAYTSGRPVDPARVVPADASAVEPAVTP